MNPTFDQKRIYVSELWGKEVPFLPQKRKQFQVQTLSPLWIHCCCLDNHKLLNALSNFWLNAHSNFTFSYNSDLEWKLGLFKVVSKCRVVFCFCDLDHKCPNQHQRCCSEPVKSAHLGCRLAYPPPADPDTLAPAVSESALSVSCSPSLLPIKTQVFRSSFLCGHVFVSQIVWEWYSPHDWVELWWTLAQHCHLSRYPWTALPMSFFFFVC